MYRVIKPFTYAGQSLEKGDAWEPAGHRNDAKLVSGRFVLAADAMVAEVAQGLSRSQIRKASASAPPADNEPAPRRRGRVAMEDL